MRRPDWEIYHRDARHLPTLIPPELHDRIPLVITSPPHGSPTHRHARMVRRNEPYRRNPDLARERFEAVTAAFQQVVDQVPRPATEIKQRYARLIACIALRTLHEVVRSTPNDVIEAVVFNGR